MNIISVLSQKGGTGKSTTSLNLAYGLSEYGKVLLIDLDAQANLTVTFGQKPGSGIFDVLKGELSAREAVIAGKIDILRASPELSTADMVLSKSEGRAFLLKKAIKPLDYDFCIIDCPPSLGMLTTNALCASDYAIITALSDIFSVQAVKVCGQMIDAVKARNKGLKVLGILVTRYDKRARLNRDMVEALKKAAEQMDTIVFDSMIREGVAIRESQLSRQSIFEYAGKSNPAQDYKAFTEEIINRIGENR